LNRILFLLSGNISSTPRAFKAYQILKKEFQVDIVGVSRSDLWDLKDQEILQRGLEGYTVLKGLRKNSIVKWTLLQCSYLFAWAAEVLFKKNLRLISMTSSKSAILLLQYIRFWNRKKYTAIYSFSATLYPAYFIARKQGARLFIDLEDYHPGEYISGNVSRERKRREQLFRSILPVADGITVASPLIAEYTRKLVPESGNMLTILNSFPGSEFSLPQKDPDAREESMLKFVWYSQRISFGRGLELLFQAVKLLMEEEDPGKLLKKMSFTIIGELDPEFKAEVIQPFVELLDNQTQFAEFANIDPGKLIQFHEPMESRLLHKQLSGYDIGLALEVSATDMNRELCLTNKIISYAQAGLYILATDTLAQKKFIGENPDCGILCGQDPAEIAIAIQKILDKQSEIRDNQVYRFKEASNFAWENESRKLLTLWEQVLEHSPSSL
jgi:glycosyltransferase involved in cell wall biosynthesis